MRMFVFDTLLQVDGTLLNIGFFFQNPFEKMYVKKIFLYKILMRKVLTDINGR